MDYNSLYKKYYKKVHLHVSRMLNNSDVDDTVQEVFIKIAKGLANFEERSKISTWIHRITVNHCIDIIRKRKIDHLRNNPTWEVKCAEETPCVCESVEAQLIKTEMNECIKKYIKQLPESFSEIVMLSDIEGFSNKEIAKKLDISIDLVKIRLHRGRLKLKNVLTKQCCLYYNDDNELACVQK